MSGPSKAIQAITTDIGIEPAHSSARTACPDLSIVIPTLNAGRTIEPCLRSLAPIGAREIILADGGSTDDTSELAEFWGARLLRAEVGRGTQLAAGARIASASWVLFHHADTRLGQDARTAILAHIHNPANETRAAYFRFCLDDAGWPARWVEAWVALRCRLFALPFGDQSLLIHRRLYDAVGGYRPLPLMEDVSMVDRLGRDRLEGLPAAAITSADRYRSDGYLHRGLRNLLCFSLYRLGVQPDRLLSLYTGRRRGS